MIKRRDKSPPQNDAPVVRLVNLILAEAAELRSTHVAIHRTDEAIIIRYWIDGHWIDRERAPRRMWSAIVKQFKTLTKQKLDETLTEGIVALTVGDRPVSAWVRMTATAVLIRFDQDDLPEQVQRWWRAVGDK